MNKFSLIFLIAVVSCSGNSETSKKVSKGTEAQISADKTFACPMQCEGEKVYAHAGKCPVCKMDLQEIAFEEADSTKNIH